MNNSSSINLLTFDTSDHIVLGNTINSNNIQLMKSEIMMIPTEWQIPLVVLVR